MIVSVDPATQTSLSATRTRVEGHGLSSRDYRIAWSDNLADAYEQLATDHPSIWAAETAARWRAQADRTADSAEASYQQTLDQAAADHARENKRCQEPLSDSGG